MTQPLPASQTQNNSVGNANVGGDFIFNPTQIIQISVAEVTQRSLIKASPYKGLERFNYKDRELFFGRDKLINRLLTAVYQSSFSLVLGASGSGKFSVVRAGLIYELQKSVSLKFRDFLFTPNEDPFESIYCCLLNEEKDYSFNKLEVGIARTGKANTLVQVIRRLKKEGKFWIIFIDQFEEIFTRCNQDKANNFIEGRTRSSCALRRSLS